MRDAYRARETTLGTALRGQQATEHQTRRRLRLAEAADAELRRRHPGQPWPPLPVAEPKAEPGHAKGHEHAGEHGIAIEPGQNQERDYETQPPAPAARLAETARRIEELTTRRREFAARLAERHSLTISAEEPGFDGTRRAFPLGTARRRTAILQPPKPEIQPSPWILDRLADRDLDPEAAN